jgi:hypothetical protein
VEYNLNRVVCLVADFGGYSNGRTLAGGSSSTFTYLFGPRFNWRKSRLVPYAQFLFGGADRRFNGSPASTTQNGFATAAGGGVDIAVTKHTAVKPIQLEYVTARPSSNSFQNNSPLLGWRRLPLRREVEQRSTVGRRTGAARRRLSPECSSTQGNWRSKRMRSLLALGLVVLTAAVLPAAGGDERTDQQQAIVNITPRTKGQNSGRETVIVPKAIIRIDTTLVSIPAVVTDPLSRFVTGLDKEHFSLYEDKVEQQIIHLSSEDTPLSIGIVFDTSGSMGAKLSRSRQAASQFLKTANPEDEFFLVEFNDRPDLVVGFTPNVEDRFESVDVSRLRIGNNQLCTGHMDLTDVFSLERSMELRTWRHYIATFGDQPEEKADNCANYSDAQVRHQDMPRIQVRAKRVRGCRTGRSRTD